MALQITSFVIWKQKGEYRYRIVYLVYIHVFRQLFWLKPFPIFRIKIPVRLKRVGEITKQQGITHERFFQPGIDLPVARLRSVYQYLSYPQNEKAKPAGLA